MTGNELKASDAEAGGIIILFCIAVVVIVISEFIRYMNNRRWVSKAGFRICAKCKKKYDKAQKEYPTTLVRTPVFDGLRCDDCCGIATPRVTVESLMKGGD